MASAGSIAFHGGFVALALLVATLKREPVPAVVMTPVDPVDVWSGVTAAIGGERLVDVNVDALGGQAAPGGTEPPPRPRAKKPRPAAVDPNVSASAVDPASPDEKPASRRTPRRKAGGGDADGANGDGAKAGPFGAEGPSAVRSLGRAFTRGIPAACQADPGWSKLPVGDAGSIEVAITLDESGHITGYKALASDPPKQLAALVKRTIALLDAGTFALQGDVGAGVEVLRIQARVSDLEAEEAGGVAALSFGAGEAAFTQESGRHVEVTLRVVKVDVPAAP